MGAKIRPWYGSRKRLALELAIPIVFLIGREVHLALTAERGSAVDYSARMMDDAYRRQGGQSYDSNGWFELVAALQQLRQIENEAWNEKIDPEWPSSADRPFDAESVLVDDAPAVVRERTKAAIASLEAGGAFDRIDAAMRCAVIVAPVQHEVRSQMEFYQSPLRRLVRLDQARLHLLLKDGRPEDAYAGLRRHLRLASRLSHQGGIPEYYTALAIAEGVVTFVNCGLVEGTIPCADAAALLAMLDEELRLAPPGDAVRGEMNRTAHWIQWQYTDDGNGDGRFVFAAADDPPRCLGISTEPIDKPHPIDNLASRLMPSKRTETRWTEQVFAQFESLAASRPADRGDWRTLTNALKERTRQEHTSIAYRKADYLEGFIESCDRWATLVDGTRLHLGIEAYRERFGSPPPSLAALSPDLPVLPVDSLTGSPFRYKLLQAGLDPCGRQYLLYSIGADGKDDAGAVYDLWPQTALRFSDTSGYDYVVNAPRQARDWGEPFGAICDKPRGSTATTAAAEDAGVEAPPPRRGGD